MDDARGGPAGGRGDGRAVEGRHHRPAGVRVAEVEGVLSGAQHGLHGGVAGALVAAVGGVRDPDAVRDAVGDAGGHERLVDLVPVEDPAVHLHRALGAVVVLRGHALTCGANRRGPGIRTDCHRTHRRTKPGFWGLENWGGGQHGGKWGIINRSGCGISQKLSE